MDRYLVGVDIGGTFTDCVALDGKGNITATKAPSTPGNFAQGMIDALEVAVRRAVQFGQDTDTTACIAGGIAGLRDGIGAIPQRWRDALRGRDLVDPLWLELLRRWA